MKGRLLIFCGIPASGKTTIARVVCEKLQRAILVQTDAVRGMLGHPSFRAEESKFVYGACNALAREALREGYTVLLDGTFMREEYRSEARNSLQKYYGRVDVVHVECRLDTALRRNASRRARIPAEKVRSIYERFEAPRRALRIDSARMRSRDAGNLIVESLF